MICFCRTFYSPYILEQRTDFSLHAVFLSVIKTSSFLDRQFALLLPLSVFIGRYCFGIRFKFSINSLFSFAEGSLFFYSDFLRQRQGFALDPQTFTSFAPPKIILLRYSPQLLPDSLQNFPHYPHSPWKTSPNSLRHLRNDPLHAELLLL